MRFIKEPHFETYLSFTGLGDVDDLVVTGRDVEKYISYVYRLRGVPFPMFYPGNYDAACGILSCFAVDDDGWIDDPGDDDAYRR